ncbi:MAG: putative metal-binding motif-containing protein [Myxococcales bacterium]|jgi:hypothetical protein
MHRTIVVTLAALLALAGCFEPVSEQLPGDQEAGPEPACSLDSDCPPPSAERCAPQKAICEAGACKAVPLPVVWKDSPGACVEAADCDCQSLVRDDCEGAFECLAGTCTWTCREPACSADRDCPVGMVCEPGPDCETGHLCVPGCHDGADCPAGQICERPACVTCPCPGKCVDEPACLTDADCPAETVCESTPERPERHCIPGCRDDRGCSAGETCVFGPCPECVGCLCVGQCQPAGECSSDEDCPRGSICEVGFDCERKCLPGACRSNEDCGRGFECSPALPCVGCGCDLGACIPAAGGCQTNADCDPGHVCGWTESCERACVPGCRSDTECGQGFYCGTEDCDACFCNNPRCKPVDQGCRGDAECGAGMVCEPMGPDCSGPRQCVRGCHSSNQCGELEMCVRPDCNGCPCPGFCEPLPACFRDEQCGPGMICESCGPNTPGTCLPGCRSDAQCAQGESCVPVPCGICPCPPGICLPDPGECVIDADCPDGMVCELSAGCLEPRICVPGCHESSQCSGGAECVLPPCFTCPCPGWCEQVPGCVDADNDGYVADCIYGGCPNVRGYCDCDDQNPRVFPGASEVCGDGIDQDCDDLVDEGCGCASGDTCFQALDCVAGVELCAEGCCIDCPALAPPACQPGECVYPGGINLDGCPMGGICAPCCFCPATIDPVCGVNYATYQSECEAACAGVEVLHRGPCLRSEGLGCGWPGAPQPQCPPDTYCRDTCPMCGAMLARCTKLGACEWDWDCPAGLTPPPCGAGPGRWACVGNTCVFSCP